MRPSPLFRGVRLPLALGQGGASFSAVTKPSRLRTATSSVSLTTSHSGSSGLTTSIFRRTGLTESNGYPRTGKSGADLGQRAGMSPEEGPTSHACEPTQPRPSFKGMPPADDDLIRATWNRRFWGFQVLAFADH